MTRKEEILNKAIEFVDKNYMDVGIKTTHEASVAACQEIAEWADKTMIEKAWDWIEDNMLTPNQRDKSLVYFEQFKKYMEGE